MRFELELTPVDDCLPQNSVDGEIGEEAEVDFADMPPLLEGESDELSGVQDV